VGDIEAAKRNIRWVKSAIEDNRFDRLEEAAQKVDRDLEGVSGPDAEALAKELAGYRKQGVDAERAEKAKRLEDEVSRNIQGADPKYNAADRVEYQLKRATEILESDDGKKFLAPETVLRLRGMMAKMRGESSDSTKKRVLESAEPRLK